MPRPPIKRRRQNSFLTKSPKKRHLAIPDQTQAREQHEKKLLQKPVGKRPDNSDDSEDIVSSFTTGRNRKRQEIYASGAVAQGDKPGAYPTKAQRTRTIREHTEEILSQRSRSASRATSVASARSTPIASSASDKEYGNDQAARKEGSSTSAKKQKRELDKVNAEPKGVSPIPQAEISVLGKLKPRKRQASILQLIENDNNNSAINTEDEAEFLPDDISAPINEARPAASSPQVNGSSSLKRKRDSDQHQSATDAPSSSSLAPAFPRPASTPFRLSEDQLPAPTRSQQRALSKKQKDRDDVMAPPESSDDESANERPAQAPPPSSRKQRKPVAPSTEQLQDLMPSKRLKSRIRRQQLNEFEIPDDSSSVEELEADNDESAFLPPRNPKAQKRGKTKHSSTKAGGIGARTKTKTKIKETHKSTRNTSFTPSPARLRTPRPLSSTKSGTQAKSPSKQDTILREKPANTPQMRKGRTAREGKAKKQYGGSHLRRAGKENEVGSSFDEPSGGERAALSPRETTNRYKTEQAETAEVKAWNKKWGDIDDFALEFEENTASTRSNSPRAR